MRVDTVLEGRGLSKTFRGGFGGRAHEAFRNVDVALGRGETLGLMGPSGCGKSTAARILLRLLPPSEGSVWYEGREITRLRGRALLPFRRRVQLISQRPESFFDPHMTLGQSLVEPLKIFGDHSDPSRRTAALLEQVKLTEALLSRYPHQVSGGEIQRLSLCRALLLQPEVLVLDEPTSMLDVSVQAQILQILKELKARHGLSYLFITHDGEAAAFLCDRVQHMDPCRG